MATKCSTPLGYRRNSVAGGGSGPVSNQIARVLRLNRGDHAVLLAPERFVGWLRTYSRTDSLGYSYQYHPRSDAHSKKLAELVWEDLQYCPKIKQDAASGRIKHEVNYKYQWPGSGKVKTIDLAIGPPGNPIGLREVWMSCEMKAAMTEHKKAQPRIFDELQSSYRIVNHGAPKAIAAGITFVNIAGTFVSPLRQRSGQPLEVTTHNQPVVTASMVAHLRGLPLRNSVRKTGFDAYCTFVVDCDNQGAAVLWATAPAPQPGDPDHYETFLKRICQKYTRRFS